MSDLPPSGDPNATTQDWLAPIGSLASLLGLGGDISRVGAGALVTAPYLMATAAGGGQDSGELPAAIARAATADFRGPFAGMTTRDVQVNTIKAMYGPQIAAWFSSRLGPMDDPIRLMAQRSISDGGANPPPTQPTTSLARLLAGFP